MGYFSSRKRKISYAYIFVAAFLTMQFLLLAAPLDLFSNSVIDYEDVEAFRSIESVFDNAIISFGNRTPAGGVSKLLPPAADAPCARFARCGYFQDEISVFLFGWNAVAGSRQASAPRRNIVILS